MNRKPITSRLYLMYAILLVPLMLFGIYKNGILLYQKDLISGVGIFKPLIMILMGGCGSFIGKIIKEYKTYKNVDIGIISKSKVWLIESFILSMVLPINSSPLILFIITLLFTLFLDDLKFNRIVIMYLVVQFINYLLGLDSFKNVYENSTILNYDGFDLFLGLGTGGSCSTSVILLVLSLIFLSFNKIYKKDVVYSAIFTFLILGIIPNIITASYTQIFNYIFGYNVLFIYIFVLPCLYSTCYTSKGQILYGVLIGILTYLIGIISPYNAAMISILIVSPLKGICDRIFVIR